MKQLKDSFQESLVKIEVSAQDHGNDGKKDADRKLYPTLSEIFTPSFCMRLLLQCMIGLLLGLILGEFLRSPL